MIWPRKYLFLCLLACEIMLYAEVGESALYQTYAGHQLITAQVTLSSIDIKKNESMLDIGCGPGDITAYVASLIPQGKIIGADSSADMVSFSKRKYASICNLSFEQVDIRKWPYQENQFDRILSFSCLHWIENLEPVFFHVAKSLKPSGNFTFSIAHADHFLYRVILQVAASEKWQSKFHDPNLKPWYPHTPESIELLLKKAELNKVFIKVWKKKMEFGSKKEFEQFIRSWIYAISHMAELTQELKEEFIQDALAYFLKDISYNADGSFSYLSPVLLASAQK